VTLIYRRPLPDEAEAMAALHIACWRECYVDIVPRELMEKSTSSSRLPIWRDALSDSSRVVFAAYDGEIAIGFILVGKSKVPNFQGEDGHIAALYLAASHYRQGIGSCLISIAAAKWIEQGGHSLSLSVLSENIRARHFYEALGARLVKLSIYEWDEHELPNAIYVFEDLPKLAA
jgi:ribosomal protein S18 acetylase RimI-like enzyme